MSMTLEEAIELKAAVGRLMYSNNKDVRDYNELIDFIESALRPVSREQVEKVWSGCEYCTGDVNDRSYLDSKRLYLDENGILTDEIENIDILRLSFCPVCGKPLTDEAVEITMRRLEALNEED